MGKRGRKRAKRKRRRPQKSKREVVITIPKTKPRGRPRGFSPLTRVKGKKQAVYGDAITFSSNYKKAHGETVKVRQGRGGPITKMPMYRAERQHLRQTWGITPRKTAQRL